MFAGEAGVVTVDASAGPVRAGVGMQFATNGYEVKGDSIELAGTIATVRVGDGSDMGASFTATIASALTGQARLEKTDLGTLKLTGTNTYSGGTQVRAGVLEIADDAALGASSSALTLDGGTLRTTAAVRSARNLEVGVDGATLASGVHDLTLSGKISGTGKLSLTGAGARAFSGDSSSFGGATDLVAGNLNLVGKLGGRVGVAAPAMLTGAGSVGHLDLAGTLSPNAAASATANFSVTGDAIFRAGSHFNVDLAANGMNDRIDFQGQILIEGGNVVVNLLDPTQDYRSGVTYRIVNATGGLTGRFAGLTENSAFLDFNLGYDPNGAYLTSRVYAQFTDVARTFNQSQAALALTDLKQDAGSDALAMFNALLGLAEAPARAAFDLSSGEIYPT